MVPAAFAGVVLIWATTPLAIKWSSEGAGFLFGVSSRMLLGALVCVFLLAMMGRRLPWHRGALGTYVVAGLGLWAAMTSVYWAARFIPSGLISVIFGLTPLVTGVMSLVWLDERPFTPARVAGMVLGVAGLALIFGRNLALASNAGWGVVAMVFAVAIHSASAVWVKRVDARLGALETTTGALIVAVPLYCANWLLFDGVVPAGLAPRAVWSIVYLAVFGSALGFIMYFHVLNSMSPSRVALITLVTPILALLLGQWANGEKVGLLEWTGTAVILGGLVLYHWGGRAAALRGRA